MPAVSTPYQSGLPRRTAWALALIATLTMAVSYVDRQTLAVLAPTVTRELGISEKNYGWLVSAFALAYLVGAPLAGQLIDRVGSRRGLLGAVLVWSAVAAAHALAPGFGVLLGLRIALGLAEAPSFPAAAQTIYRALPPADRARGFGVLFTGSSFGAMLAPPIATALEHRFGYRAAFLGTAAVGLLWVPLWLAIAWKPAARPVLDAAEHREGPGLLEVARHPVVLRALIAVFAAAPMIALLFSWGAKYLVRTHGLTQSDVGKYLLFPPLLMDAGSIAFGHFASKRAAAARRAGAIDGSPPRALFALAAAMCAAGAAMPLSTGPVSATVLAGVAVAGGGGMFALLSADALSRMHPSAVSKTGGMTAAAQSLAQIIAGPIIGASVERTQSYTTILIALGAWVLPGAAVWLLWTPPPARDVGDVEDAV